MNRIAFSPDGKTVVTSGNDGTARIWDPLSGKDLTIFKQEDAVTGIAFSRDGKYLVTGSYDGNVRLWEIASGKLIRLFTGHQGWVFSTYFSPDGKYILTASNDGTARLWLTDIHETIRAVCAALTRDLTSEELMQFDIAEQGPTCSTK